MITHNTLALLTNVLNIIHPLPQYTAAFYSPQAIKKTKLQILSMLQTGYKQYTSYILYTNAF